MINSSDFSKRLQKVIDYYGITASALADELGIQRSSISHLLSERNKPSLDFVLKMEENFPELDLHWLTKGEGEFPPPTQNIKTNKPFIEKDLFSDIELDESQREKPEKQLNFPVTDMHKKLDKIVFFYTDSTFEVYTNS